MHIFNGNNGRAMLGSEFFFFLNNHVGFRVVGAFEAFALLTALLELWKLFFFFVSTVLRSVWSS